MHVSILPQFSLNPFNGLFRPTPTSIVTIFPKSLNSLNAGGHVRGLELVLISCVVHVHTEGQVYDRRTEAHRNSYMDLFTYTFDVTAAALNVRAVLWLHPSCTQ